MAGNGIVETEYLLAAALKNPSSRSNLPNEGFYLQYFYFTPNLLGETAKSRLNLV